MLEWANSLSFPGWSSCTASRNDRSIMNKLCNIRSRINLIHSILYLRQRYNTFLVTVTELVNRDLAPLMGLTFVGALVM